MGARHGAKSIFGPEPAEPLQTDTFAPGRDPRKAALGADPPPQQAGAWAVGPARPQAGPPT